jgi:AcrR family transcriptional regulator
MSMAKAAAVSTQRKLTPAQAERRRSVLSAARALAKEGGYEAVTISAVAKGAGVSRSTLYHYFVSKGHLLAELTLEEAIELNASFDSAPPVGSSPEERIGDALERLVDWSLKKPKLFTALTSAWTSKDISEPSAQRVFNTRMHDYLNAGFGESSLANTAEIVRILEHIVFSCLLLLSRGIIDRDQAVQELRLAARLLLSPPAETDQRLSS